MCRGLGVIEGVDNTVLYGVAGAGLFVLILAISAISMHLNRQRAVSDERQVYKLRRKRAARYEDAKKDYEKYRKKIESGNTVLVDLIHDLGDDFVGGTAPSSKLPLTRPLRRLPRSARPIRGQGS